MALDVFMLMNTGDEMMLSKSNLLSTTAYKTSADRKFALEGSIFNAGTVVQWMRDELILLMILQK